MASSKKNIKRYTFSDFCFDRKMRKADLARMLDVKKQQVTNWERSNIEYLVEHNVNTGRVDIIRAEKVVKSCMMSGEHA